METLFESGAASEYPNFYTPLEWEAFLTLKFARAKDQEKDFQTKEKGRQQSKTQAELEARMRNRL
jgi:hypothetical protein